MIKRNNRQQVTKILLAIIFVGILVSVIFFLKKGSNNTTSNSYETGTYLIKGIDISHHNAIPNWSKLDRDVSFVYMKATEGTNHEDRNYPDNYELAKESDVKVGTYHFYSFAVSGKEQAQHFIRLAKVNANDLIPAIDVEHSRSNPYSKDKTYVNKVIKELKILESELHKFYGVRPIIYTNKECYALYIEKHFPDNLLWIVDLDQEPPREIKNWRIWQFSHKGKVIGIEGRVDLNFYRYTTKEFDELLVP